MEQQMTLFAAGRTASSSKPHTPANHAHFDIYVDGASRGNPGHAGAGIYVVANKKPIIKKGIYLGEKTNNQAEYLALALAVFFVDHYCHEHGIKKPTLSIFSDSELLIRQMKGIYKVKNEILAHLRGFIVEQLNAYTVRFTHVMRENNTHADKLANLGIDKKHKLPTTFAKILSDYGLLI